MNLRGGEGMRLELEKIPEGAGPYTMSYGFNLDVLCESIRKVGVLNPPLVARNQEGAFDIVSGYRRILALKALGEHEALCKDVTTVLTSPLERFVAAFYENLATRKFNDIEKAIILHKLLGYDVEKEEILATFMPLLSLLSHEGTLKLYLKLLDLEENVQKAIAREELSMKVAKALVDMEKGDREILSTWINSLALNFNQQIKFIEYARDISIKENAAFSKVLSEGSVLDIAENPRLNKPQKAKAVLEFLRVRRFPRLAQAQHAVKSALSSVDMPPEASIYYDPYLESPYYRLEINFTHGKDLKSTISRLHALHELEAIPEVWTEHEF